MNKIEVGQKLWFVPTYKPQTGCREVTVERVGRKYFGARGYRFSIATLHHDHKGGFSVGRCYLSRAEHEAEVERAKLWAELHRSTRHRWQPPANLTTARIRGILEELQAAIDKE